jgi:peroxiredoxin
MKMIRWGVVALALTCGGAVNATPQLGAPAPDFTLTDVAGKPVRLADYKGRHVVLEWTNPNCPYVAKHYETGNMQALQKEFGEKGVVWLSISSTRPSHPEYVSEKEVETWRADKKATPTRVMLDKDGKVGRLYDARTTPHMYVIDPKGRLIFAGGIDDKRTFNHADVKTAKNFVRAALDESMAGKPVSVASATPYG